MAKAFLFENDLRIDTSASLPRHNTSTEVRKVEVNYFELLIFPPSLGNFWLLLDLETPRHRVPHGLPHGSLTQNFKYGLTLYSFSVQKTEKIETQHALSPLGVKIFLGGFSSIPTHVWRNITQNAKNADFNKTGPPAAPTRPPGLSGSQNFFWRFLASI